MSTSSTGQAGDTKPIVVKKYANRRLYNTATSSYVTLEDLAKMIKEGGDFVVHDAKTGEDITRSVLTQIIVEQEQKGAKPAADQLPAPADRILRRQHAVPGAGLSRTGDGRLRAQPGADAQHICATTFGIFPFGQFEEMGKQNMALFEQALKMLSPYGRDRHAGAESRPRPPPAAPRAASGRRPAPATRLEAQIEALRQPARSARRKKD